MKIKNWLKYLIPLHLSALDDEVGGEVDLDTDDVDTSKARGDDFTPTEDDVPGEKPKEEKEESPTEEKTAEEVAAEEEAAKAKAKKDTRIPLSRHEAILERQRKDMEALATELAKYKNGAVIAKTNEDLHALEVKLDGLDDEYAKLLMDGELEKAKAVRKEIRALTNDISDKRTDLAATAAESRAYERVRYDTAVERIEAAYPVLNQDDPAYDPERMKEVVELKGAYEALGLNPTDALQKAVRKEMGAASTRQEEATDVKPRPTKEEVEAQRKADAMKKNVDAARRTPADASKLGVDTDKAGKVDAKALSKLSQEEFAKLGEDVLAKARGDEL